MDMDLTDIKQDGELNPFDTLTAEVDEQKKETSGASSAEIKQTETTPSQKGVNAESEAVKSDEANTSDVNQNVPLNKDKRFKDLMAERDEARRRYDEADKTHKQEIAELKKLIQGGLNPAKSEIPPAFKKIFGEGNEELWKEWQTLFPQQKTVDADELRTQLLAELKSEQEAQAKQQKEQMKWVDDEVSRLKDEGKKFDKNELLSILEKYRPVTDDGSKLDFDKAYEIWEMQHKSKPENQRKQARKDLAATTVPSGNGETVTGDAVDLANARKNNWDWRKLSKF